MKVRCDRGPLNKKTVEVEDFTDLRAGVDAFQHNVDGTPFRYVKTNIEHEGLVVYRWDPYSSKEAAALGLVPAVSAAPIE